jgi:hypothetical protein
MVVEVPIMKESIKNKSTINEEEQKEELFSIPNEATCSAEFSEGCIFTDQEKARNPIGL